jgi:hypothetical protein
VGGVDRAEAALGPVDVLVNTAASVSSGAGGPRYVTKTEAPLAARTRAVAAPIPWFAPVTSAM